MSNYLQTVATETQTHFTWPQLQVVSYEEKKKQRKPQDEQGEKKSPALKPRAELNTLTCRLVSASVFHLKLRQLIKTTWDTPRGEVRADSVAPPTSRSTGVRLQSKTGSVCSRRAPDATVSGFSRLYNWATAEIFHEQRYFRLLNLKVYKATRTDYKIITKLIFQYYYFFCKTAINLATNLLNSFLFVRLYIFGF